MARLFTRHPLITVAAAFLVLRAIDWLMLIVIARRDLFSASRYLTTWDGEWYFQAITSGYPATLPLDGAGVPVMTTWAWPPVYPMAVRVLAAPIGAASIPYVMVLVNLVCGVLAAVVLYRLLAHSIGTGSSIAFAVLWASMPAAPSLMLGYAEGPFILLVFLAMLLALRERFIWAGIVLVLAGLTKSSVAPYALAIAICAMVALRSASLGSVRARAGVGAVLALLAIAAWPIAVAVALGSPTAYAQVQQAWNRTSIPGLDSVRAIFEIGTGEWNDGLIALIVLLVATGAAIGMWRDRRMPLVTRLVGVLSPAFLFIVGAGMSSVRLLLPDVALPWLGWRLARGAALFVVVSVGLLLLRWAWMANYLSLAINFPPP